MNRNRQGQTKFKGKGQTNNKDYRKDKCKRDTNRKDKEVYNGDDAKLSASGRDNDPNWYFADAALADQVSQMSFQNLAGYPIELMGHNFDVSNINSVLLNPCPGVIRAADYGNPMLNKASGINLAGYRIFSKISAFTGRTATYGPQDISTMILAMGEVISTMEWCRRAFGVANAYSMRNRSYPREVLSWIMRIDDDDFFKNYANYRTRFNALITMVNQLPIPKGIAYFEKCATLYEKVYVDAESTMAQSIFLNPWSTWILDETSDPRGSILVTTPWLCDSTKITLHAAQKFSVYLDTVDLMIGALLNSSTLQVVYTDMLNLATKTKQEFWKLDYLMDGYLVVPEYNQNMLLQMHNATVASIPRMQTESATEHYTAWNDVVPNANTNSLFYNPGFLTVLGVTGGIPRTGTEVLIDMITDHPTVEDRVECTRFSSIGGTTLITATNTHRMDAVLPDHYVVAYSLRAATNTATQTLIELETSNIVPNNYYTPEVSAVSSIDWFPQIYECNSAGTALTGNRAGDLNYYTVLDGTYLAKLHQFMTLGLYDLRSGS